MAAIVHPEPLSIRPALRLVPPLQPTRADYARRRLAVLVVVLLLAAVAARLVVAAVAPGDATVSTRTGAGAPATPVTVHAPLAYGSSGTPVPDAAVYVVQPGDTVWSIARELAPGGDVRGMVDRIVGLNGGAALQVGQHLRLS